MGCHRSYSFHEKHIKTVKVPELHANPGCGAMIASMSPEATEVDCILGCDNMCGPSVLWT